MITFPFGTNGKLTILGVPIFKHITVIVKLILSVQTQMRLFLKEHSDQGLNSLHQHDAFIALKNKCIYYSEEQMHFRTQDKKG